MERPTTPPRPRLPRWFTRLASTLAAITPVLAALAVAPAAGATGAAGMAITVVGDSLTVGTSRLRSTLLGGGWNDVVVSAQTSRHIHAGGDPALSGIGTIRALRAGGRDTTDWVIALGTNDLGFFTSLTATENYLQDVVDEIGDGHRVAFVTLAMAAGSTSVNRFNTVVRTWARAEPDRFLVVDWDSAIAANPSWYAPDGLHYTAIGYRQRERVITGSLQTWLDSSAVRTPAEPISVPVGTMVTGAATVANQRVVDTRSGFGLPARLAAKTPTRVDLTAAAPTDATGAIVNLTTTGTAAAGYLSASGCDVIGSTSAQNYSAADTVASLATVPLDELDEFCVLSSAATHLVIDVVAWLTPGGGELVGTTAQRVHDSRSAGRSVLHRVPLTDVPADAEGVLINLTVPSAAGAGYAVARPCDTAVDGSNLNFSNAETVANLTVVPIGTDGAICVEASTPQHVVVDVVGWIGSPAANTALVAQTRLLDTRSATGGWSGRLAAGQTVALNLALPTDTAAALFEVIATGSTGEGFVTIYPCDDPVPATSNLNTSATVDRSNLSLVRIGDDELCIMASVRTHVVVDVQAVTAA